MQMNGTFRKKTPWPREIKLGTSENVTLDLWERDIVAVARHRLSCYTTASLLERENHTNLFGTD